MIGSSVNIDKIASLIAPSSYLLSANCKGASTPPILQILFKNPTCNFLSAGNNALTHWSLIAANCILVSMDNNANPDVGAAVPIPVIMMLGLNLTPASLTN